MNEKQEKTEKSYEGTTKFSLILRVIAALYLLYMTFTMVKGYMDGDGLPFVLLVAGLVVFTCMGAFVTVKAVMSLVKGEYSGGKADKSKKDVEESRQGEDVTEKPEAAGQDVLLSDRLKKYNERGVADKETKTDNTEND